MRRRLRKSVLALSLILLAVNCTLMGANCFYSASIGRIGSSHSFYFLFQSQTIAVYFSRTDAGIPPRWLHGLWTAQGGPTPGDFNWRTLGFGYGVGGTAGGNAMRVWIVPCWSLALALAVLPAGGLIRRWRMKRRKSDGRCRRCGYDLRATPGRCPECGTVPTGSCS